MWSARLFLPCLVAAAGLVLAASVAAEPVIHVGVGGQVSPGVYGRVELGKGPLLPVLYPLPLLYPQPVVVVREAQPVRVQPVYLHVPPAHARHWSKHCVQYDACARPVYFVKSSEYAPAQRPGQRQVRQDS